jgi:hypothetical protein
MSLPRHPARPRATPASPSGFSLIEVILSVGILAIAIVSLLGLIGPTLGAVKTVIDTDAGVSAIGKMNAILDTTPFYNGTNAQSISASVYTWVRNSSTTTPTVFFFFNELNTTSGNVTPSVAVTSTVELVGGNNTNPGGGNSTVVVPLQTLLDDAQNLTGLKSVDGPIIAMTISISPMAQDSTSGGTFPTGENYYTAPSSGIFPSATSLPSNPNSTAGATVTYPEAYLPILVQAFTVSTDQLAYGTVNGTNPDLTSILTDSNRIFTFTTAKLR